MKPYDLALSALRYAAGDASSSEYPPHADERASEIRRRAAAAVNAYPALVEENARLRKALDACRDHFEDHEDGQMLGLIELALAGK